jgi:hypothetical protein
MKLRDEPNKYGMELRWRYMSAYPVNSGVYASGHRRQRSPRHPLPAPRDRPQFYVYDGVPTSNLFDIGFNYRLPFGAKEDPLVGQRHQHPRQEDPLLPRLAADRGAWW